MSSLSLKSGASNAGDFVGGFCVGGAFLVVVVVVVVVEEGLFVLCGSLLTITILSPSSVPLEPEQYKRVELI